MIRKTLTLNLIEMFKRIQKLVEVYKIGYKIKEVRRYFEHGEMNFTNPCTGMEVAYIQRRLRRLQDDTEDNRVAESIPILTRYIEHGTNLASEFHQIYQLILNIVICKNLTKIPGIIIKLETMRRGALEKLIRTEVIYNYPKLY